MREFLFPSKPKKVYDPAKVIPHLTGEWVCQFKLNGSRAEPSGKRKVKIFDRHGTTLTISTERNWNELLKLFPAPFILDGELIGRKQGEVSNRLYLWDAPVLGGEDLTKKPYGYRYKRLQELFAKFALGLPSAKSDYSLESPFAFVYEVADIEVSLAKSFDVSKWKDLASFVEKKYRTERATGEFEGLVFKNVGHNLAWHGLTTREISQQLKFLFKYYRG